MIWVFTPIIYLLYLDDIITKGMFDYIPTVLVLIFTICLIGYVKEKMDL